MKIDFQCVFRFLHDSWRRCRANTGRERQPFRPRTSLELQQSEVMVPETQTSKAVDDAEENHIQHLEKSAVVASRVVSSPSTQTTASLKTCRSKSWNVQMTWLMTLHTDVGLNSCPCGVIRTILSWICSEMETSVGAVQHPPHPPRLKVPVHPPQRLQTIPFILTVEALQYSPQRHSENTANYRADIRGEVTTRCKDIAELFWGGFHKVSYFQTVETYSSR